MPQKTSPERLKHQIKALLTQNSRLEMENTIEAKQQIARNETIIYKMNERLNKYISTGEGMAKFPRTMKNKTIDLSILIYAVITFIILKIFT